MAVFSTLLKSLVTKSILPKNGVSAAKITSSLLRLNSPVAIQVLRQMSGHRTIAIKPSRWQWNRFKDLVHFYTMLGVIPSALVILYVNLFIGPAKLAEIPEGYVPESHEFHSHPITRWLVKNVHKSYQQEYENMCHHIYEEEYKQKLRLAEKRVKQKMLENQDTQAYYYQPVSSRYQKFVREVDEKTLRESTGFN
uniref:NADH dehydrogenase [ubiquinone] 1 beta subcomplex subunit 5, mitochondrial n=1 Tax=Megafenestra aurita TaxID=2291010 RepID=A0A4Y7NJE9_9CRUS|nr:EOG090X0FIE [Megafenestra aurita]SVE92707.1 EOG090X0FIE [Megafenestra aurita]